MIFKIEFEGGRTDWAQAPSQLDLLKNYATLEDEGLDEIEDVTEISEEEAKKIMFTNTEHDSKDPASPKRICLFDLVVGEDFAIVGSTEFI